MNIGYFTDSYRPYTSGVVRSIETFTRELKKLGHQVYIFAPMYKDCEKEPGVFRYLSVPSPTNQDFTLAIPISLRARPLVRKLKLDIIHVHSPFLMGRLGAHVARAERIPLVYTYHTLYDKYVHYVPFAQELSSKVVQKIATDFSNRCDLVIVPTSVIGEVIRQNGVRTPLVNIPTGIEIDDYRKGDSQWLRQTYRIPEHHRILLFVGRIGQEKNIEFLIRAFYQVQQRLPDTTLVLVGGGPQEQELKELVAALGISEKVVFTGTLEKKLVINCYLGADLFVFASVTETQGLVIGEAKAAGLPVVAIDAFGVKEMVTHGHSGFLCQLDQREFVSRITTLLEDHELYKKMSAAAQEEAQLISAEACAKRLVQAYWSVVRTNKVVGY